MSPEGNLECQYETLIVDSTPKRIPNLHSIL